MTVIFILDDDNMEIDRMSFYVEPSKSNISPELESSIRKLPDFLQKMYNSGLNNENIQFITDEISVD